MCELLNDVLKWHASFSGILLPPGYSDMMTIRRLKQRIQVQKRWDQDREGFP